MLKKKIICALKTPLSQRIPLFPPHTEILDNRLHKLIAPDLRQAILSTGFFTWKTFQQIAWWAWLIFSLALLQKTHMIVLYFWGKTQKSLKNMPTNKILAPPPPPKMLLKKFCVEMCTWHKLEWFLPVISLRLRVWGGGGNDTMTKNHPTQTKTKPNKPPKRNNT